MPDAYLLGIDIGTSGCKSILIDHQGNVIGSNVQEYSLLTPQPGWAEQKPSHWLSGVYAGIRELLAQTRVRTDKIRSLGLSGQMHGLVALDKDYKILRPAILWNDQRSVQQCQRIYEIVGSVENLLGLTNNKMLPGYTGGKILWMRENEQELYDKTRLFLNPKDYVRYELTGEIATEVSDASGTGLFDVKKRCWCDPLLDLLEIPRERLPKCFESTEITGHINKRASELTGLPEAIPVVGGGGDAVVQTTGMGLVVPSILGTIIGTSGIVALGLDKFEQNPDGRLQVFCNNSVDTWHAMGVTLAAGGSYRWYKDALCQAEKRMAEEHGCSVYRIMEKNATAAPPGSKGLIFLPYLIGERCPYADPNARGALIGLGLHHGRSEITRAVMEGVVFSLKDVYELIRTMGFSISQIRTSGGGALSPLWRQIQADVFQCPVTTVSGSGEGGAYGAALLAGVGMGIWGNLEQAVNVLKVETETLSDPKNRTVYEDMYGVYRELYKALKPSFDSFALADQNISLP